MKKWTFILVTVTSFAMLLLACGGTESGETDGSFFDACTANTDCQSGVCAGVGAGTSGYCSMGCNQDAECQQYVSDSCCSSDNRCVPASECNGSTTDGDNTTEECTDGDYRCSGNDVQVCSDGLWTFYRSCTSDQVCESGACVAADGDSTTDGDTAGECSIGETRCNIDKVERCNVDKEWELLEQCGASQECENAKCVTPQGVACTLEEGCEDTEEYCLEDELGGEDGHCMPYCGEETNVVCPAGWQCVKNVCEPIEGYCEMEKDCPNNSYCAKVANSNSGICTKYCDLPGENCRENYYCETNTASADYGHCIILNPACIECSYDDQCGAGKYCEIISGQLSGCCKDSCTSDDDCGGSLNCSPDGRCVVGTGLQECDVQCQTGYICDKTFGECVLNCPACGPNECCDEDSAPNCYTCTCQNPVACGLLMPPCCFGYSCSTILYGIEGFCI